jgi:hypothetical protein
MGSDKFLPGNDSSMYEAENSGFKKTNKRTTVVRIHMVFKCVVGKVGRDQ